MGRIDFQVGIKLRNTMILGMVNVCGAARTRRAPISSSDALSQDLGGVFFVRPLGVHGILVTSRMYIDRLIKSTSVQDRRFAWIGFVALAWFPMGYSQ